MGNLPGNKVFAWTEDDYKVSRAMQEYFANFIKTGNPGGGTDDLPKWPATNSSKEVPVMHINVTPRVEPEKNGARYHWMEASSKK